MNRRDLLTSATLIPAAALAATAQQTQQAPAPVKELPKPTKGVKITVLKRSINTEFQQYRPDGKDIPACTTFKDGQETFVEYPSPVSVPDGFCPWAWNDVLKTAWTVYAGRGDRAVACCSSGMRPVYFLIERAV